MGAGPSGEKGSLTSANASCRMCARWIQAEGPRLRTSGSGGNGCPCGLREAAGRSCRRGPLHALVVVCAFELLGVCQGHRQDLARERSTARPCGASPEGHDSATRHAVPPNDDSSVTHFDAGSQRFRHAEAFRRSSLERLGGDDTKLFPQADPLECLRVPL
jgi:hypothetical protein